MLFQEVSLEFPKKNKNKTFRCRPKLNITQKRHKGYMKGTVSSVSKHNSKYEPTNTLPRMNFSTKSYGGSSGSGLLFKSQSFSRTQTSNMSKRISLDEYADELNHFTNDNFGYDPFGHFS
jgi:hypothetical protein